MPPPRRQNYSSGSGLCRGHPGMRALVRAAAPLVGFLFATLTAMAAPPGTPATQSEAAKARYPTWRHGGDNDAAKPGLVFTMPPVDVMADFHGSLDDPALVLYVSGNYFFAMGEMVRAFGDAHPAYRERVFYETLPPGLLMKQL
jgi:molybdate transport system substrate-binding protein